MSSTTPKSELAWACLAGLCLNPKRCMAQQLWRALNTLVTVSGGLDMALTTQQPDRSLQRFYTGAFVATGSSGLSENMLFCCTVLVMWLVPESTSSLLLNPAFVRAEQPAHPSGGDFKVNRVKGLGLPWSPV